MTFHLPRKTIVRRPSAAVPTGLDHLPPVLRRIYGAREVRESADLARSVTELPSADGFSGMNALVERLCLALERQERVLILADFDADGATSCAVAVRGLRAMGLESVAYLVPNRFEFGYGLTPEIVAVAQTRQPSVIVTVDNGISSHDGVDAANAAGIDVLVTDHHVPPAILPRACAIVNPNLPGDPFPSKALAGVGVMFYVLVALRSALRGRGWFVRLGIPEPNLAALLDCVALGTVADIVPLDRVNRILVFQGLQRIRAGQGNAGIRALLDVAGRDAASVSASDLGFALGPRLNAAGRMDDMSLGIACLLADDESTARGLAVRLDDLNRERRDVEASMQESAWNLLNSAAQLGDLTGRAGICLYDPAWHQGVVGILASRVKDRIHRPTVVFADAQDGLVKGSGRSIPGVHIRDAVHDVATQHPGLITHFGGHAMACGLLLATENLAPFAAAFDTAVAQRAAEDCFTPVVYSDGELAPDEYELQTARVLRQAGPWGQGFPEPAFDAVFDVVQSRVVGERHVKFLLKTSFGKAVDAIAFAVDAPQQWLTATRIRACFRLDVNAYRDVENLQLVIQYLEPA